MLELWVGLGVLLSYAWWVLPVLALYVYAFGPYVMARWVFEFGEGDANGDFKKQPSARWVRKNAGWKSWLGGGLIVLVLTFLGIYLACLIILGIGSLGANALANR